MLTNPHAGWTEFSLPGTNTYALSYLDDIAFEWAEQAIHGLETMLPFCVKGFMEPGRILCTVSYWNCHLIIEDDERAPLHPERIVHACAHISMLEFCRALYTDISAALDDWALFADYQGGDPAEKKRMLSEKLKRLHTLLAERESWFGPDRCFL